ncbi:MAG: serine/threonine-protein kinase [Nocardioides sp.]
MTAPSIPGFTYIQHIGQGGFADVFLYEQQWPRQRVAVKVVRPDLPLTERDMAMLTTEADAMARLADHPYIVSVITAGTTSEQEGSRPFLVMRYCPPPDLGQRVQVQPMAVSEAVATGIKLASAIETAHRSGILHRDIKPSNVLVTTYNEPALTDFGIAGRIHEVEADTDVRISYPWSPPELLDGRSNGSVATDVYSLGATIWNLLVGRSPFSIPSGDNSSRALTARILHSTPPRTQRPDVPPALDLLLQQCLAKDSSHRPASALELARALQRIEAQAGYPRTMIAVETDLPAVQNVAPSAGGDATVLKPVTVISGSAPRVAVDAPSTPVVEAPSSGDRARLVWLLGAAAVLLVVGLVLFLTADGDDPTTSPPPTTTASTPDSIDPGAPTDPPAVTGRRTTQGVVIGWEAPDGGQPTDTWEWRRTDTGQGDRTTDTSVTVRSAKRVCVQVRLIRDGFVSPWGNRCVD